MRFFELCKLDIGGDVASFIHYLYSTKSLDLLHEVCCLSLQLDECIVELC